MSTTSKQPETGADASGETTKKVARVRKQRMTKKAILCTLLRKKGGARIATLQKELGWQPHTVRAAISGVCKTGESVECLPGKAGPTYRIVKEAVIQ